MTKLKLIKPRESNPKGWYWKEWTENNDEPFDYSMDGLIIKNLKEIKRVIKNDWDYVIVVDGEVGAGKSIFAQQVAYYLTDGQFCVDDIVFDPKQFRDRCIKAKKYSCIVFDEAFRGLSARSALTQTNKILMSMLQEIRQRNLFILIVLPSIWDLDKYISLHRCKGLFHIEVDDKRNRGYFKFFKKQTLMNWLRENNNKYRYPKLCSFRGRFNSKTPIDEIAYKAKKKEALGDYTYDKSDKDPHQHRVDFYKRKLKEVFVWIKEHPQFKTKTLNDMYKKFGLNRRTMCDFSGESGADEMNNVMDAQDLPQNIEYSNKSPLVLQDEDEKP